MQNTDLIPCSGIRRQLKQSIVQSRKNNVPLNVPPKSLLACSP